MNTRIGRLLRHARRLMLAAVALVAPLLPAIAHAQDDGYVKVEGKPVETIAANPFIAGAYGFIWVAVLVYVVYVARGLGRAQAEIQDLKRTLERRS